MQVLVIQFCRLAYVAALDNDERKVSVRAIAEAEEEFSRWRFEHLWSEHLFIYPELESLLESFRHQQRVMPYDSTVEHLTTFLLHRIEDNSLPEWIRRQDEKAIIRTLFSIGFLGFRDHLENHGGPKKDFVFQYERPAARLRDGVDLSIHPGYWRHLEIQA